MRSTLGRFTSLAVVAATAIFVACDDSPTDPPVDTNPVVLSATGSMSGIIPPVGSGAGPEGFSRTFTFDAVEREDGGVTGQMQYEQAGDIIVTQLGTVSCMRDLGDGIILVAAHGTQRVANVDPTALLGLPDPVLPDDDGMIFAIRDNGEAGVPAADQYTGALHTTISVADAICADPASFGFNAALAGSFFNDVESGDIEVGP